MWVHCRVFSSLSYNDDKVFKKNRGMVWVYVDDSIEEWYPTKMNTNLKCIDPIISYIRTETEELKV